MKSRDTSDWPTIESYPKVKAWTDIMIAEFPTVMKAVVDRPFGSLHNWIEENDGVPRGCFIGTTEILMNELLSCITVKPVMDRFISAHAVMQDFLLQCKRENISSMTIEQFGGLTIDAGITVSYWATFIEENLGVGSDEVQEYVVQEIKNYIRSKMPAEIPS